MTDLSRDSNPHDSTAVPRDQLPGGSVLDPDGDSPRTTSSRQVEANRRNAQLSTGPRTRDGRARSSMNALVTGLYATTQTAI